MKLVTHDGKFHYDEVLASSILLFIYPNAELIRTRDLVEISKGDIVYDVGSEFNPSTKRFDHHQHSFKETYSNKYNFKLSSAGLIYKYFQKELFQYFEIYDTDPLYERLTDKVYNEFFLGADCVDNGIDIWNIVKPRTIYDVVNDLNVDNDCFSEAQTKNFYEAVKIVSDDFIRYMYKVKDYWLKYYSECEEKIKNLSGHILQSDKYYDVDLILDIEKQYNKDVYYLVYPQNNQYRIRAINVESKTMASKLPLKEEWRGKRGKELNDLFEGAIFVHYSGFIGIHKTKEGALKMCENTINSK